MEKPIAIAETEFAQNVFRGLSATPKFLSSRYFYNEKGDSLFQQIMKMPSYYLTRCEQEILENEKESILNFLYGNKTPFQLIELGAGDGTKTKILLQHFLREKVSFEYYPIDISHNALSLLKSDLNHAFPKLTVKPQQGEYFEALRHLSNGKTKKVILFLGSNIGNFTTVQALEFLKKMANNLQKGDLLFIGFDLKKEPSIILEAYNDKEGITKAFNLNLLERINLELGGNFNLNNFDHFPNYNPETGEMKSYLISTKTQDVFIEEMNQRFHFTAWETIYMEISQKYGLEHIKALAEQAGFSVVKTLFDSKRYFVDALWEVK